jgi:hypothetical protein
VRLFREVRRRETGLSEKKTIFFGPWVGEFGFELLNWIGQCEAIKNRYPEYYAVASSYWGRKALYKFCDYFLPHTLESNYVDTKANRWMGESVVYHPEVASLLQMADIIVKPGKKFEGFSEILGEGQSIEFYQKTMDEQVHRKLVADENSIRTARKLSRACDKPVIVLVARNYQAYSVKEVSWVEDRWKELASRLIEKGWFVVSLLSYMPTKPCYLANFTNDNFLNLGTVFKDSPDFCEMQIAFLNIAKCAVMQNGGGTILPLKAGTSFVEMMPSLWLDQDWSNGAYRTWELFSKRYGCKSRFVFGDDVPSISVDEVLSEIESSQI